MRLHGDKYEITDKRILSAYNKVSDGDVKKVLLGKGEYICKFKFLRDHESAFRKLMPQYFDLFISESDYTYADYFSVERRTFAAYMCLELGIVDVNDVTTAANFVAAGVERSMMHLDAPKSTVFLKGLGKSFDERAVLDFIKSNPEMLLYFLPLMTAVDSDVFAKALCEYLTGAGLQDTQRYAMLEGMLTSPNASMLLKFLDFIDENNLYRLKAFNEVAISLGHYDTKLSSKELVPVLRAAAKGETDRCMSFGFGHAYYFITAYDRIAPSGVFKAFAYRLLKDGCVRARQALLRALKSDAISEYAKGIFDDKLTADDLSFIVYRLDGNSIGKDDLPDVFECLYRILLGMDKVSYHFKTDDEVLFARDVDKSMVVRLLSQIANRHGDMSYTERLDAIYNTWREEAQAEYLEYNDKKTALDVRAAAIAFLKTDNYYAIKYFDKRKIKLTYDEAVAASDYLKSKKQQVKTKLIKEFMRSDDRKRIAEYLCGCAEEYKRQAGEEMKASDGKVSKKELEKATKREYYWETESVFEVKKPSDELKALAERKFKLEPIPPISYKRYKAFTGALEKFFKDNADHEYETGYNNKVTLGCRFTTVKRDDPIPHTEFKHYPLGDELKALFKTGATELELAYLMLLIHCAENQNVEQYYALFGRGGDSERIYNDMNGYDRRWWDSSSAFVVLRELEMPVMYELLSENTLCRMAYMFASDKCLKLFAEKKKDGYSDVPHGIVHVLGNSTDKSVVEILLCTECAWFEVGAEESVSYDVMKRAYEYDMVSAELERYFMLKHGGFDFPFNPKSGEDYVLRKDYAFPKFKKCLTEFLADALDAEFKRGSLQTPYSNLIRLSPVFGINNYMRAIVALRGLTWARSPCGCTKNEIFSKVLKYTRADENDGAELFCELAKKYELTRDELIRATLFNPVYVDYTAKYLGIPDLKLAVYWFVAHLNEVLYGEEKDEREEKIKEFSDISYPDFQDGAFDYAWYKEMTGAVPEKELKCIYDNAKYVTVGGLHKRAQRFFDAVGGRIDKKECLEKMSSTRNKDYCLIYSLIPVKDGADLYERYEVLSEFLRQSKQFGAQRQASEKRTVDIAFENLARAAGYSDPNVFIFEMESQNPSDIYKTYEVGDITVTPYIDLKAFKLALAAEKDGKKLASIPAKYGKDKTVVTLRDEVKTLNKKFVRIKHSMENCMVTRAEFTPERIRAMSRERMIAAVLEKLVLLADGKATAVYRDGKFFDLCGNETSFDTAVVAHPAELKQKGLLGDAVGYVVKNNIVQPFKQILREIYTKSEQENEQDEVLRFRGFSVDLKKCVAALKGKGWSVSEDIGLRKVYYKTDIIAAIFREFDDFYTIDFENVNRELHGIFFLKRKSGEIIELKDIDDITFSETLRDVDLMITISSNTVYDFELAMSTVEIRQEILKSIVALLKLDNVTFLKDNIKVAGYYGTYVINIRTGLVFKEGKGNLLLDTVYSVDKPLLLDFIDEDPMTADIISKAVVLSGDKKITDPKILFQIQD